MSRRDHLIRRAFRERFLFTLRSGESFEGLLFDADEKTIQVVDAHALQGSTRVSVDGQLYLPRAEVSYMQKPGVSG